MRTKFDYELENFKKAFSSKKTQKIALYGTGRMTATLLGGLEGFNIVGLCDRDESLIGKEIYGKRILNRYEVEQQADILVINTSEAYWNTIYKRIRHWNIPIFFCNGMKAGIKEKTYKNACINTITPEKLEQLIDENQIVSFDIFDTLVMRRIYCVYDLFRLTELKIHRMVCPDIKFVELRKMAATDLSNPTLDDIYRTMEKLSGLPHNTLIRMKQIEIETEKSLLVPREEMVDICRKAMMKHTVYFISDMYYSADILLEILRQSGLVVQKEQILVSSEYKSSKADGSLWDYYKRTIVGDRTAIHIGDDENADHIMPVIHGIKAVPVMSAADMLGCSSIREIIPQVVGVFDSLVVGHICAKLFNSPFSSRNKNGILIFSNFEDAGYCLLGMVVYSFLVWLLKRAMNDGIKELLFFSREGYFLVKQYQYMVGILGQKNMPVALELEISRRAVWGASIRRNEDIYEVASFPFLGSVKELLTERFGLTDVEENLEMVSACAMQQDSQSMRKMLVPYEQAILSRMEIERDGYLGYIDSLNIGDSYAVVDSQYYGSTQFYLGKLLKKRLKGYYFCACLSPDNKYLTNNEMEGCFGNDTCEESSLHKYSNFLESFFTAPHGMLVRIKDDGSKVYAENMSNQQFFDTRVKMNNGILKFIQDMIAGQGGDEISNLITNERFADQLFEVFMDGGFEPSQQMKESFFFDNGLVDNREAPIWE